MTVGVITVNPATSVKECAQLLLGAHIGGLPVVDVSGLVGIVTSSDMLADDESMGRRTAADIMHPDPVCLTESMSVGAAARLLSRHHVKRAPVVRNGKLVGIVTRSDLLRPYLRTDSEIRADVEENVLIRTLGLSPRNVTIDVSNGVVELHGSVEPNVKALLLRLTRAVDGVVDVDDDLEPKLIAR